MSDRKNFWVIGIGASAGGLEAIGEFVSELPVELDACFIIAQHLAPHARSMMVELLNRHATLKVEAAVDGQTLAAGQLLIVPPNYDIDLKQGRVVLTVAGEETRPKPSVDRFFSSLAREYGERAVGIILSGSGSDGAEGIRAIKSAGGLTLAQDEKSAKYNGMPSAAIETGKVDRILNCKEMAQRLPSILNGEIEVQRELEEGAEPRHVLELIRNEVGSDFSKYKMTTIKRRLAKRMSYLGVADIGAYLDLLKRDPQELHLLANELLVSVTSFFRDEDAFRAIREILKKILIQKKGGEEIRIWSAGCATGEEPYSLAMMLCDLLEETGRHTPIKVFATDLDHDAISHARLGIYSEHDVESLPPHYVEKFFERRRDAFEIKKGIRDLVVFARQDLVQNPPFVKLDLVSCRNVLIYFEIDLQKRVLEIFHYALKVGGVLFLGKSEGVASGGGLFDIVDKREKIFTKRNVPSKVMHTSTRPLATAPVSTPGMKLLRASRTPSIAELAQKQILEIAEVCGVVVDDEGRIQTVIGDISPYCHIPSGLNDFSIQNLLDNAASVELQVMLRKAAKDKTIQLSRALKSVVDPKKLFSIAIEPIKERTEPSGLSPSLYVVSMKPLPEKFVPPASMLTSGDYSVRLVETEQELAATREHLQTVIEELGVTNEELQSVNEELSSTNEELQSSNEELETTNEELQATNEELTTINEEMSVKSNELRLAYADIENIQSSIGFPLLVVDSKLSLKRYNPAATELFELGASDIGRAITRVSCRSEIEGFEKLLLNAVSHGQTSQTQVETPRAIYHMRIMPARNEVGRIGGAVIVFINNTEVINAEARWKASETRIRSIIDGASSLICLKDMMGRYQLVNRAFLERFRLNEKDLIGQTDRDFLSPDLANQMRNGDLEAILKRTRIESQETIVVGDESYHYLVSRFPIFDAAGSVVVGVGTVGIDITAQVRAQQDLVKNEELYRSLVEEQIVFVCRLRVSGEIVFVNNAFAHYFGGQAQGYIGSSFLDLMPANERARVMASLKKLTPSSNAVQIEHRVAKFGNLVRWVRWMAKSIYDEEGKLLEIQAVGFDVSDYRLQSEQLTQRDALFSSILMHTNDLLTIYRVTPEGDFILDSFNRSPEQGPRLSYAQYLGRSIREIADPQRIDEIVQIYTECLVSKKPQTFDEELVMQGGVRFVATTLIPVMGTDGSVESIAAMSRDISRFKRTEMELKAAKEAAEVANQSKSDFLASMSHELRTPLNVVIGMSQLLETADLSNEESKQLASIQRSGRILLGLIEDVLDLSRIEAGKVKLDYAPFSITELIEEVIGMFEVQASHKALALKVDMSIDGTVNYIGDAGRIRQILINFIGNAIKFTDRGEVTIRATSKLDGQAGKRILRFEVRDTGIGIPKESHSRIFHRFSQVESGLSRRYGGSGLGLVISKRLITLMDGDIGFTSEFGEGSTFWFEVPVSVTGRSISPRFANAFPLEVPPSLDRKVRVLGVDDSSDSLHLLRLLLERLGYEAVLAKSGAEAIEILRKDSFDIILMDVQMPGMDGYETTAAIRKMTGASSSVPIVALTANAMVGDSALCFEAGMNDYVTKPIELDLLRSTIEKWLKRSKGLPLPIKQEEGESRE